MSSTGRLSSSLSPAAMLVAILALVLAGAGVGWSAATIGTSNLENNAVTSPKVKNGTLKAADLKKEKQYTNPSLNNGSQGDCVWIDLESQLAGLPPVGFRVDRFGTTHLSGIMSVEDGPGGDAACGGGDNADAIDDFTAFTLPKPARPTALVYRVLASGTDTFILLIPGPGGLEISPGVLLPHGAVMTLGGAPAMLFLDEVEFESKASKVTPRPSGSQKIGPRGRELLEQLLQR